MGIREKLVFDLWFYYMSENPLKQCADFLFCFAKCLETTLDKKMRVLERARALALECFQWWYLSREGCMNCLTAWVLPQKRVDPLRRKFALKAPDKV